MDAPAEATSAPQLARNLDQINRQRRFHRRPEETNRSTNSTAVFKDKLGGVPEEVPLKGRREDAKELLCMDLLPDEVHDVEVLADNVFALALQAPPTPPFRSAKATES